MTCLFAFLASKESRSHEKEASWRDIKTKDGRPGHQNGDSIGRPHVMNVDLTVFALFSTLLPVVAMGPTPTCVGCFLSFGINNERFANRCLRVYKIQTDRRSGLIRPCFAVKLPMNGGHVLWNFRSQSPQEPPSSP